MKIREQQAMLVEWESKMFDVYGHELALLGIGEEFLDETFPLLIAYAQGNRDNLGKLMDAMCDIMVYSYSYCNSQGFDAETIWVSAVMESTPRKGIVALSQAIGKIFRHHLKQKQGIRGTQEEHMAAKTIWLRAMYGEMNSLASQIGFDLVQFTGRTLNKIVTKRDWRKNPTNAHETAPQTLDE